MARECKNIIVCLLISFTLPLVFLGGYLWADQEKFSVEGDTLIYNSNWAANPLENFIMEDDVQNFIDLLKRDDIRTIRLTSPGGERAASIDIADIDVPDIFTTITPCKNTKSLYPGCEEDWRVIAIPFGQITADQLLEIADQTQEIIFSINRCLVIDKTATLGQQFITSKDDLRYHVTACAGMPACTNASISTKQLALNICESQEILAGKSYHISGCSKGCAMPSNSDICITGELGSYNMLENGCAWDKPSYTSLSESALMDALLNLQI